MLNFFRKYQRFFFLIITVVIVVSFSLFGTYNTLMKETSYREQVAFTSVDGSNISRIELEQMAVFLGTDEYDKLLYGGIWGPNFLNSGVIRKNILETGLGLMLAERYNEVIASDLKSRLEKEKRYVYYSHPLAAFINAEAAWSYFAPDLKANFDKLREEDTAEGAEALQARIDLFLSEKKFPATVLRQVLRYQEKQYSWITPDENLNRADLSLFGYHTIEDWFGPYYMKIVSEFIINSAKIAEQRGYKVTKEETLVDLMRNAEISFQQNQGSPHLGVANSQEYFNEQLRLLNMDQTQAIKVWRQVLLFRRLFQDVGSAVFVDSLEFKKFDEYAKETVEGNIYQLPLSLRFGNYQELQKFEIYLEAVAKKNNDPLALPTVFLTASEVEKQTPELVQRNYLLEIADFDKKALQSKVSLKETWNWEVEDSNWEILKKQFPDLGIKTGSTREERYASLDSLNDKVRNKVDAFAREAIVDAHPDWLQSGLEQAKFKKMVVGIRSKGGEPTFVGLQNPKELIALLDSDSQKAKDQLNFFTANQKNYYRIRVIDRDPNKEILSFAEANSDGTLNKILRRKLDADYQQIRDSRPLEFQKADKSWKPLDEVQDIVANHYFDNLLKAIREDYKKNLASNESSDIIDGDFYARHRLYKYVRDIKTKIQQNPEMASSFIQENKDESISDKLPPKSELKDQWKLQTEDYRLARSDSSKKDAIKPVELFNLKVNEWTRVYTNLKGNVVFFQLLRKSNSSTPEEVASKMEQIQVLPGDEAQRILMNSVLNELEAKKAISVDFLKQTSL